MSEHIAATKIPIPPVSGLSLDLFTALDGNLFPKATENSPGMFAVPYAAIVLVEDDHLWFRSRQGFTEASTLRDGSLWDAVMETEGIFIVEDLLADPRYADESHVIGGLPVRFFASAAIFTPDGRRIGAFCVADPEPGVFDPTKQETLVGLANWCDTEIASIVESNRAAEVQEALLPKRVPPLEGYEVAGVCVPAKAVGGDFYDWYAIDGGIAFTLADVMGKGVGAGIIAATVRATIRSAKRSKNVATAVARADETLEEDLREAGSFVTLFHARLRAVDGRVRYLDAGHGLSVVVDADGTAHRLESNSLPLGTNLGDGGRRERRRVMLEKGGTLVSFSDGVLDLFDGSLAAVDRVVEIAQKASSAREIVGEIERLARRDGAPDDVTVVAIRRSL